MYSNSERENANLNGPVLPIKLIYNTDSLAKNKNSLAQGEANKIQCHSFHPLRGDTYMTSAEFRVSGPLPPQSAISKLSTQPPLYPASTFPLQA